MSSPAQIAQIAMDTARRLDGFMGLLDLLAKDTTGLVPIAHSTIGELKDTIASAREACDLVAGAHRRIDPTAP